MSILKVNKGSLIKEVHLPSSKSYANRALILAALNLNSIKLNNLSESTDVTILIDCLKQIGLEISGNSSTVVVQNSFPACETKGGVLEVGEGGTTARFLAGLLLRGKAPYELILGERLKERPWDDFIELVTRLGGKAELNGDRLKLQGPIQVPKVLEIDCTKTTQFASSFQLAFAGTETKVIPTNMKASQSYWNMTEKLIQDMHGATSYDVPLDWSSASYPLAFAALNQEITFPGLVFDSYQADAKFYSLLEKLGAIKKSSPLTISPIETQALNDVSLDVSDCLDLVPTLGYFLSHIPGTHALSGIGNLIYKESDRLGEVIKLLNKFNKKAWTEAGNLYIEGSQEIIDKAVDLTLPNDHRMVMVGTLFLLHHHGGSLKPIEAVDKSYPGFFYLLSKV